MYNYLFLASSESDSDKWEVPSHESYSDEEEELDSDIKEELLCELHKLLNYIPIRRHIHPIRRTLIDIRIRKICLFLIKIKEQESQPIFSSETAELLNETYDSESDDSYHPDDDEDEGEDEGEDDEEEEDEIPMLEPNESDESDESDESNKQNDIKMENKSVIDDKGKKIITFKDIDENDSEKDTSDDDDDDESSESESSESEKSEDESNEEPEEEEPEESNQKSQSSSKKLKQPKENIESDESIEAITFDDKELDEKELLETQKEIKKILSQSHNSIYGNSNGIFYI